MQINLSSFSSITVLKNFSLIILSISRLSQLIMLFYGSLLLCLLRLIFQRKARRFHPRNLLYSFLELMKRKYIYIYIYSVIECKFTLIILFYVKENMYSLNFNICLCEIIVRCGIRLCFCLLVCFLFGSNP